MTLSTNIRLALETRQREQADQDSRRRVAETERELRRVHWENLRACGTHESIVGKLWFWEDKLPPAGAERKDDFREWLELPKHDFGTAEWAASNDRICRETVEEVWMLVAGMLTKHRQVEVVLNAPVQDPTHSSILEPFRELLRRVAAGEAADRASADAARDLAEIRVTLREACKEIGQAFCALADAAFPRALRATSSPVSAFSAPMEKPRRAESALAEDPRHARIRARVAPDRVQMVIHALAVLDVIEGTTIGSADLTDAGIPTTTIRSESFRWKVEDVPGRQTHETRFSKAKVAYYVENKWSPKLKGRPDTNVRTD